MQRRKGVNLIMTDSRFELHIRSIQKGDKTGLKEIYEEYGRTIYNVVMQVLKNPQDAEDVTSEFFIKLWNIADTYCFGGKHKRWLMTIARNMAVDYIRKNRRELLTVDEEQNEETAHNEIADTTNTENAVVEKLSIHEALKTLDDGEREIVNMHLLAEMTFKDIAEVLGKPLGTVSWKYRTALAKLKKTVKEVQMI